MNLVPRPNLGPHIGPGPFVVTHTFKCPLRFPSWLIICCFISKDENKQNAEISRALANIIYFDWFADGVNIYFVEVAPLAHFDELCEFSKLQNPHVGLALS